jgi:hypothetical protein
VHVAQDSGRRPTLNAPSSHSIGQNRVDQLNTTENHFSVVLISFFKKIRPVRVAGLPKLVVGGGL